ncbi:MAG: hypothetical protein Salg2KO_22240 [Salibacteraceae bacterium]
MVAEHMEPPNPAQEQAHEGGPGEDHAETLYKPVKSQRRFINTLTIDSLMKNVTTSDVTRLFRRLTTLLESVPEVIVPEAIVYIVDVSGKSFALPVRDIDVTMMTEEEDSFPRLPSMAIGNYVFNRLNGDDSRYLGEEGKR